MVGALNNIATGSSDWRDVDDWMMPSKATLVPPVDDIYYYAALAEFFRVQTENFAYLHSAGYAVREGVDANGAPYYHLSLPTPHTIRLTIDGNTVARTNPRITMYDPLIVVCFLSDIEWASFA